MSIAMATETSFIIFAFLENFVTLETIIKILYQATPPSYSLSKFDDDNLIYVYIKDRVSNTMATRVSINILFNL